jgi:hypothetical protein
MKDGYVTKCKLCGWFRFISGTLCRLTCCRGTNVALAYILQHFGSKTATCVRCHRGFLWLPSAFYGVGCDYCSEKCHQMATIAIKEESLYSSYEIERNAIDHKDFAECAKSLVLRKATVTKPQPEMLNWKQWMDSCEALISKLVVAFEMEIVGGTRIKHRVAGCNLFRTLCMICDLLNSSPSDVIEFEGLTLTPKVILAGMFITKLDMGNALDICEDLVKLVRLTFSIHDCEVAQSNEVAFLRRSIDLAPGCATASAPSILLRQASSSNDDYYHNHGDAYSDSSASE